MIRLSVVICTYNRANLLSGALESLVNQSTDPSLYEIIVVNNASTDNTAEIVKASQAKYNSHNIRLVYEKHQGLSYARNTGWRFAKGKYVAYIDDDCKIPPHWISKAKQVIKEKAPDVFGGPYYAFFNSPKPKWYQDCYASHTHGDKSKELNEGEYLDGGNIFFRKALLQQVGGFDIKLGMCGDKIAYGEETALLRKIREFSNNYLIYYDPELHVYHLVAPKKMTIPWIIYSRFINGRYSYRVLQNKQHKPLSPLLLVVNMGRELLSLVKDLIIGSCFRDHNQYPYWQNYFYEKASKHLSSFGGIYERFNQLLFRKGTR